MFTRRVSKQSGGIVASLVVVAIAAVAAILTGSRIGSVNGGVEALAAVSGTLLGGLSDALPFGYAFGAGMVAAVNPCGFALLPAYLALYVRDADSVASSRLPSRLGQALFVSLVMTLAFALVFGIAGAVLSVTSSLLTPFLPIVGLGVGVLLVVTGGRLLGGAMIYNSVGERIAGRLGGRAQEQGPRGYFAYGIAYAAASLSCVLPIFLSVVAGALAAGGPLQAVAQFLLYALGMGLVIAVLTASTAFVKHGILLRARGVVRFVEPASAVLLLLAGGYIIYYWLTLGGLLGRIGFA